MGNLPLLHPPPTHRKIQLMQHNEPMQCSPVQCSPHAMQPAAMEPHIILSVELLESQQKADVVKTDYSDSLLMITSIAYATGRNNTEVYRS